MLIGDRSCGKIESVNFLLVRALRYARLLARLWLPLIASRRFRCLAIILRFLLLGPARAIARIVECCTWDTSGSPARWVRRAISSSTDREKCVCTEEVCAPCYHSQMPQCKSRNLKFRTRQVPCCSCWTWFLGSAYRSPGGVCRVLVVSSHRLYHFNAA